MRPEYPCGDPVGHCLFIRAEADVVGDEAPPAALFAERPAGQLAFDDLVHLDAHRVVAASEVWFAGEQGDQINQDGRGWPYDAEHVTDGLPAVADGLHVAHGSIICSNDQMIERDAVTCSLRPTAVSIAYVIVSGQSSSCAASTRPFISIRAVVAIAAYLTGATCESLLKPSRVFANYEGPQRKSNMCTETRKAR